MIRIEKNIIIHRPVEQVFAYLTALDNGTQWQSGLIEEKKLSPGPVGPGTTFRNISEFMGQRLESILEVTEYEPNRKYSFHSVSALIPSRMTHLYEPVPEGTRLTVIAQGEIEGIYKFMEALASRQVKQKLETDLRNIKRILESER